MVLLPPSLELRYLGLANIFRTLRCTMTSKPASVTQKDQTTNPPNCHIYKYFYTNKVYINALIQHSQLKTFIHQTPKVQSNYE